MSEEEKFKTGVARLEEGLDDRDKLGWKTQLVKHPPTIQYGIVAMIDVLGFKKLGYEHQVAFTLFAQCVAKILEDERRDLRKVKGLEGELRSSLTSFGDTVLVTRELPRNWGDWWVALLLFDRLAMSLQLGMIQGLLFRGAIGVGHFIQTDCEHGSVITTGPAINEVGAIHEAPKASLVVAANSLEDAITRVKMKGSKQFSKEFPRLFFHTDVPMKGDWSGDRHFLNPLSLFDMIRQKKDGVYGDSAIPIFDLYLSHCASLLKKKKDEPEHEYVSNTRQIAQHIHDKKGNLDSPMGYYRSLIEETKRFKEQL